MGILCLGWSTAVHAQAVSPLPVPDLTQPAGAPELASAANRPVEGYESQGIRVGGFILQPSLGIGEEYDSNIDGAHAAPISDFLTVIQPTVNLSSDWGRNALAFVGSANLSEYWRHAENDQQNYILQLQGRIDIAHDQYLHLDLGYQSQHEAGDTPESNAASQAAGAGAFPVLPVAYTVETGHFDYVWSPARVGFELDGLLNRYAFSDVPTALGTTILNSENDRTEYSLTPRISYELQPGYQAFVQVTGNDDAYVSSGSAVLGDFNRNSTGYAVSVGSQFDIDRLITGLFYVGYLERSYRDPRLSSSHGLNFNGSALWNVTETTSIRLAAGRALQDTILVGSSGFWVTTVQATVEHQLLRNVIVSLGASFEDDAYQGITLGEDQVGGTASVHWLVNRNFSLSLNANVSSRSSNEPVNSFERNQVTLTLSGRI